MTRRRLSIVALFVAMVGILVIPSTIVAQQGQERVSICHRDGRGQFHLITIAVSAVPAHLAHGDHFPQPFYVDSDGDGFGNPADTVTACVAPDGYVTNGNDCDDSNAAINPGQPEVCNGLVDEGVTITLYRDADGDGYGNPDASIQACTIENGYVTNADDCYDENPWAFPGQTEWFTEGRGDWYWEGGDWYWSYDYDCSGLEEQQWTDLYGGSCYQLNWWSPTCSSIQPGWQDSIPECGNVGVWVIGCYWVGYPDFCSLGIGYRQQACH